MFTEIGFFELEKYFWIYGKNSVQKFGQIWANSVFGHNSKKQLSITKILCQ